MIIPCILVLSFELISSGLLVTSPVYPVSESCLVLPCPTLVFIKDYYLSLRPRLRVPVPPSCVHRDSNSVGPQSVASVYVGGLNT